MEGADIVRRLFDAVEAFGGNVAGGLLQILGGHAQGRPHVRTVEPPDILEDGAVAALADRVQHGTHIRFHGLIGVVAVFQKPQQFRPHGF